jgi:hypothetical protein
MTISTQIIAKKYERPDIFNTNCRTKMSKHQSMKTGVINGMKNT